MSVIQDLFAVIGLDTKGFREGVDQAKAKNKELDKSFSSVDKTVGRLQNSFVSLGAKLGGLALSYLSIRALSSQFSNVIQQNDALGQLSESLGVSVEQLDMWGNAVARTGGTSEGFQASIKNLTTNLTSFSTKGKSALTPFFAELGIRMTDAKGKARDVFDILPELSSKFEKLSLSESFGIGQKLGLDEGTIRLLQKGQKEVDAIIKRQKELGVVTKQDAEIAAKFKDQLDDTGRVFKSLYTQIGSAVLPSLTTLFKWIEKGINFLKENKDLVVGGIIGIASVITTVLLPSLIRTAVTSAIAFAPFYLAGAAILAVIALIAMLYEDLKNYFEGNNSVIGELIKKFPVLEDYLKKFLGTIKFIQDGIKAIGVFFIEAFTNPVAAWEKLKSSLSSGFNNLLNLFPSLKKFGESLTEYFKKVADNVTFVKVVVAAVKSAITATIDAISGAINKLSAAFAKVKDFFGGDNKTEASFSANQQVLHNLNSNPFNYKMPSGILSESRSSNRSTNVNVNAINIATQATTPEGIAGGIENALQSQLTQAINNADDGVLA